MRFFSSELGQEYSKTTTFGYCNYGVLEPGDDISEMYARGYLPYSGSPDSRGMFYMARSGRLYLPEFEFNSECRRIAKKFDGKLTRHSIPIRKLLTNEQYINFWLEYFARAHESAILTRERLMHWLNFGIITHVGEYRNEQGKTVAYVHEVWNDTMAHDWHQSWSAEYDKQSLGIWILIDIARAAKNKGVTYYYPGTVYSENSYKTNLPALEFWNGETWVKDKKNRALKARTNTDAERQISLIDEWKHNHRLF